MVDRVLQHAPHFRKDLVFRGAPHAHARGRPRGGAVRFSEPHDHLWRMIVRGKPALYQNCVRMEATLKPFHSQNASFYPILIDIPDTFFGGWVGGLMDCRDGSYSAFPHALLVTLVAQRPFRICSATRWIKAGP